ncbi:hypothetical protein FE236_10990 [Mariprofundus erugo]|uniref:Twin-arginine translocase subunit TatB n=1 Tax=Mariprofundus erugo TaxID=2528639 RepID=A0A5R9GT20_9PROT|nr:twin-arginine translocase TatA/TatE family subunit [Mariprofundus erugo]TLS67593.1 hypothetical protein FEF65_06680 [Mariprofundus erugo]TLS74812.1 hypothetical protein FE236_10990 [Mariprofundus erugo]
MPDIGLFELLLIGIVLFVVVGPERMPEFLGQIGRWVRYGRSWMGHISSEIHREASDITRPVQDAGNQLKSELDHIKASASDAEIAEARPQTDATNGKQ